ncbi:hypothetical protein [Micromonospora sp. WMMD1082]|uniref:hypothetical protein n=1 Tax=Micromonospora sp. WMMD1082 TaxID=3016104 RepID=UPI00241633D6|nr:hypothetical protein [Micromonospora sp. WMMD1082]MDG4795014.1 hypothetical protein [Micromonospora sp. WMMD1082]
MTTPGGLGRPTGPASTSPHSPAPTCPGASARANLTPAAGALDPQLAHAVRQAARMRALFYVVVLLVALTGQVIGATQKLDVHLLIAIPAVATLELGGVVVMTNADVRRRLGERSLGSRILSAAVAAAAVTLNWLSHDDVLAAGFFAGMSTLGYLVWLIHAENMRRDRLRATGALPATTPAYELLDHWIRHPRTTRRARSLARADRTLGLYDSFHAARAELRREHRDAAIAKILRRKIKAAVDPTTATIAEHVYDLNEIAARLAATADYDGLTQLIATDLAPTRIASRTDRPGPRRRRLRPTRTTRLDGDGGSTSLLDQESSPPAPEARRQAPSDSADLTVPRNRSSTVDTRNRSLPPPPPDHSAEPRREDSTVRSAQADNGRTPTGDSQHDTHANANSDANDTHLPTDRGDPSQIPRKTAAAVAYWLGRDPRMELDELARRVGKTERTVRRYLPPSWRPATRTGSRR